MAILVEPKHIPVGRGPRPVLLNTSFLEAKRRQQRQEHKDAEAAKKAREQSSASKTKKQTETSAGGEKASDSQANGQRVERADSLPTYDASLKQKDGGLAPPPYRP